MHFFRLIWAIVWRWIALVGCAALTFLGAIYKWFAGEQKELPVSTSWTLGTCFVLAAFWALYSEHRKSKGKPRQAIVTKIVDEFHRVKFPGETQYGWIGLVIEYSADFGDHWDLDWVCNKLDKQHHGNPFDLFFCLYKKRSFGKRKRFRFINDARTARLGGYKIVTDTDATQYMQSIWANEHRLKETTGESRVRAGIWKGLNKWSDKYSRRFRG